MHQLNLISGTEGHPRQYDAGRLSDRFNRRQNQSAHLRTVAAGFLQQAGDSDFGTRCQKFNAQLSPLTSQVTNPADCSDRPVAYATLLNADQLAGLNGAG